MPDLFLSGTPGADTLVGGEGDDFLSGHGGPDSLNGGLGNDTLQGGPGDDTLDGGPGVDTLSFDDASGGVVVSLAITTPQAVGGFDGGVDTIRGFENLIGSLRSDVLTGDDHDNRIDGDNLGPDTLMGAGGNDTLVGSGNADSLSGGDGNDLIITGMGPDVISLGPGADVVMDSNFSHSTSSESFVSSVIDWNGAEDHILFGATTGPYAETTAPDFTSALSAANALARAGDKFVSVQVGSDVFVFGNGPSDNQFFDEAIKLTGRSLDDVSADNVGMRSPPSPPPPPAFTLIVGTAGPDTLIGTAGADSISAGDGDDVLRGGLGGDTLSGGAGADTFRVAGDILGPNDSPSQLGINDPSQIDHITDWSSSDALIFDGRPAATAANYQELVVDSFGTAWVTAGGNFTFHGIEYTAAQIGPDVVVFDGKTNVGVMLVGKTLADISLTNIPGDPTFTPPPPPPPPPTSTGVSGFIAGNMDAAHLSTIIGAPITDATSTHLAIGSNPVLFDLAGFGFTYDSNEQITGGFVTGISLQLSNPDGSVLQASLTTHNISPAPFGGWVATDATQLAFSTVLAGNDTLQGVPSIHGDLIHGYAGNDLIWGDGGPDTLFGGDGDDTIYAQTPPNILGSAASTTTFIRGEDGNDDIHGGPGFDDINGNKGDDTIEGGSGGGDWLVGGQGNDSIVAHAGGGLLYGNLGNDTLVGSDGADLILGGQANDLIQGGAGNDYISGDRGNDTETGGAGADTFHSFSGAGIDKVMDFNLAEGDRVLLDPGTHFTVSQVGADTVVDLGGGDQVILVGINMTTLTGNWIVVG